MIDFNNVSVKYRNDDRFCILKDLELHIEDGAFVFIVGKSGAGKSTLIRSLLRETDREDFDWRSFAEFHIGKQIYKNEAKIDVFDQLEWKWDEFVDYCWYTRLRYERRNPKFDR